MIITTDNYEEYFYRYCEGELTAEERAAVEAFAAQHPDLAEELSLYDPALKLEEAPLPYPDKERLMRHEPKVLPLWRWAAAACVAAVLVGGAWLLWPDGKPTQPTGMVAQMRQPAEEATTVTPTAQPKEEQPTSEAVPSANTKPSQPDETIPPTQEEQIEALPQYETPTYDEPALLAEASPSPLPQHEDTVVIEYIEMTIFPTSQPQVEVVTVACQPTVGDRFRAFRSRVSNTVRDYAYQSYSDTRAELRTRINY
ncbi:MAG: hypothetical protein IKG81_11710 [Bacteroidales bacterium]|nr:hypothetical protein [Bacteroidales bacterium]